MMQLALDTRLLRAIGTVDGREPGDEPFSPVAGLYGADAQAMFGFVRRLGLSDEQADDAVQEVFVRLLNEHGRGIAIANPRAWAYRSIYRIAMDQHRLRRRVVALVGVLGRQTGGGGGDETDRIAVWTEVDRLPSRQRQVLYLRYRSDLAHEEIGQVLGITASAARSHATQALQTLRARLAADIEEVESR
jgi:DNA-directed RNA polymerase specialized sigma24 family protein